MVIAVFGENCAGKSTVAVALRERLAAEVYTGRDYLRLHKNEAQARAKFAALLAEAVPGDRHIIYVSSEPEQLSLLPEGCVRVLVTAELEEIKARFARRLGGSLPAPVAAMLARKHGMFDGARCDVRVRSGEMTAEAVCDAVLTQMRQGETEGK